MSAELEAAGRLLAETVRALLADSWGTDDWELVQQVRSALICWDALAAEATE